MEIIRLFRISKKIVREKGISNIIAKNKKIEKGDKSLKNSPIFKENDTKIIDATQQN